MNEANTCLKVGYFAAANSYNGFISYFDKVFSTKDFTRLYILKGGPGTGKSSLMKRLSHTFSEKSSNIEEIYCSSDPHSLDGVIITYNDKRIAVIDGTAPHQRDALIPGAGDELINLGQGWESKWLISDRDRITQLISEKSCAYKTAYFYLSIAGRVSEEIKYSSMECFSRSKAKSWAESILPFETRNQNGTENTHLVSSFGKYGEYRLDCLPRGCKNEIKLCGKAELCQLLLHYCYKQLSEYSPEIIHFPTALDPDLTDAIYLPGSDILLRISKDGDIMADEFFDISELHAERMKKADHIRTEALDEAKRWFAIASDIHFRIEEIYGRTMNFDIVDSITKEKTMEIANILEITL